MLDLSRIEFPISPSPDATAFWDGVQRDELVLPRCRSCGTWIWYPRCICPRCGSIDVDWQPHERVGVLYAFCIQHHPSTEHLRPLTPFVTGMVEVDEGVRMMGLIDIDPKPESVRCGMPMHLESRTTATGLRVPVFVPVPVDETTPQEGPPR